MKRAAYSPEIRQAMLRLLEMWHLMNTFCKEYTDRINEIEESMPGHNSAFPSVTASSNIHDHIADCICQLESIYEQMDIACSFIGLMNTVWQRLTERDRLILDSYRHEAKKGERQRDICNHFSVSKNRAHQFRDIALKHIWVGLHEISLDAYQNLCDLSYRWGMLACCSQGRELSFLRECEAGIIQDAVMGTGIPVIRQGDTRDEVLPHICFDLRRNRTESGIWPNGLSVQYISKKRNQQHERILEDALVRSGCIFQIFRFRQQGVGTPYRVEYVFPFEKKFIAIRNPGMAITSSIKAVAGL